MFAAWAGNIPRLTGVGDMLKDVKRDAAQRLGPTSQRIIELLAAHQDLVEGHERVTVEFNAQGQDVSIRTSQYNRK